MKPLLESKLPIYFKNDRNFPIYATSEVILYTPDNADVQIVTDMKYFTSKQNPHNEFIVVTRIPEDFSKDDKKWERVTRKIESQDLKDYCMFSGWHCFPIKKREYKKIEALYEPMDHEKIEAEEAEKEKLEGKDKKSKKKEKIDVKPTVTDK